MDKLIERVCTVPKQCTVEVQVEKVVDRIVEVPRTITQEVPIDMVVEDRASLAFAVRILG